MIRIHFKRLVKLCGVIATLASLPTQTLFATQYTIPESGNAVIGDVSYVSAWSGDTLVSIGEHHNVGVNAMVSANPGLGDMTSLPSGTPIEIPTRFILPPLPHRGIVINLPEMRMYFYPEGSNTVMTFPVGIGKLGKTIPIQQTSIARKTLNPTWTPPADIRAFNREQGIELPASMPPGPDNPLGPYAIYLRIPTFLIHSTIFPESIGRRASFGCIRMNEGDIKQFYPIVAPGTPVAIVDIPNKVGWQNDRLYLETHLPLEEHSNASYVGLNGIVESIQNALPHNGITLVNWQLVAYLSEQRDGVPHEIGFRVE